MVFLAAVVFFAVVAFLAAVLFLAVVVFFAAAVFFTVVVFFVAAVFLAAGFLAVLGASALSAAASSVLAAAGLRCQPPRLSYGVKLEQLSLMQKGFLAPRPAFLNMVWPHTGQLSFTGTSQVRKSHLLASSRLLHRSQQ